MNHQAWIIDQKLRNRLSDRNHNMLTESVVFWSHTLMDDALKALPDEASVREDVARWAPTEALALRFEQQPHEARVEYLRRVVGTHLYGDGIIFESQEATETVLLGLERYELSYRNFLDQLPHPRASAGYVVRDLGWEHGLEALRCHVIVESSCSP